MQPLTAHSVPQSAKPTPWQLEEVQVPHPTSLPTPQQEEVVLSMFLIGGQELGQVTDGAAWICMIQRHMTNAQR